MEIRQKKQKKRNIDDEQPNQAKNGQHFDEQNETKIIPHGNKKNSKKIKRYSYFIDDKQQHRKKEKERKSE